MSAEEQHGSEPRGVGAGGGAAVELRRYARLLVVRWWSLAAGLLAGAAIGYAIALGGARAYSAGATVYLGQPYSVGGDVALQSLQTNPAAVTAIVQSDSVIGAVAAACKAKASSFAGGISTRTVPGSLSRDGQSPIVEIAVEAPRAKVAACAANGLAQKVVGKLSFYAVRKVADFLRQISSDERAIVAVESGLSSAQVSTTDKLLLEAQLHAYQQDRLAATQLYLQAKEVESPQLLTPAAASRATVGSRRDTVLVAALVGLALGVLLALLWDRIVARVTGRGGE